MCGGARTGSGTVLASLTRLRRSLMFAIAAVLIGVVGIVYVRRRSSRKKQTV